MIKGLLTFRHWHNIPAGELSCRRLPLFTRLRKNFHWEIITDKSWKDTNIAPIKHRVIGLSTRNDFNENSFNVFYSYSAINDRLTFYWQQYKGGICYSWEIGTINVGEKITVDLEWDFENKHHNVYVNSAFVHQINIGNEWLFGLILPPLRGRKSVDKWEVKINK